MITAQRFTVQIEEKLLLKLLSFFGYDQAESGNAECSTLVSGSWHKDGIFLVCLWKQAFLGAWQAAFPLHSLS